MTFDKGLSHESFVAFAQQVTPLHSPNMFTLKNTQNPKSMSLTQLLLLGRALLFESHKTILCHCMPNNAQSYQLKLLSSPKPSKKKRVDDTPKKNKTETCAIKLSKLKIAQLFQCRDFIILI